MPEKSLPKDKLLKNTSSKDKHPSLLQRKKLKEMRIKRLAEALRGNLRKRKEQIRARKQCSVSSTQSSEKSGL